MFRVYYIYLAMSIDVSTLRLVLKVLKRRLNEISTLHQAESKVACSFSRERQHFVQVNEVDGYLLRFAIVPVHDLYFDSGILVGHRTM